MSIVLLLALSAVADTVSAERPNIVLIMADDLGVGDVGCYGQRRFKTPNIDRLAADGLRFLQHVSGSPVCAPSRCVLMTGRHPGHGFIRNNREVQPEGQFPLPENTVTLARLLQQRGYATGAFGKWGLGGPGSSGEPLRQGFDRFYGYNCQRVAHNYFPPHLWDDRRQVPLENPRFAAHQKLPPDADPTDEASYAGYRGSQFAPDLIDAQAVAFVEAHKDRPFFLYVPTIVPHLALQVPEDSLAEYRGQFAETPYRGDRGYLPHRTPRAAYAAMIARMDRDVGRIVDRIESLGLTRRTIFVFTSDNGPLYDHVGGTDTEFFDSARGLRGRKGSVYEGGMRVPLIVRWNGRWAAGTSHRVTGHEDLLPTLLDLAGLSDAIPSGIDGISLAPTLRGEQQPERPFLYREFPAYGGQQSVRVGDWKAVRQNLLSKAGAKGAANSPAPQVRTELFDLARDPREEHDVANENADVVARLERVLREQHVPSAEFPFPVLDAK